MSTVTDIGDLAAEFDRGMLARVLEKGRSVVSLDADEARSRYRRLRARFEGDAPAEREFSAAKSVRREGRSLVRELRQIAPVLGRTL